jgi:glucose-1-phosphate thymidylyltransferase
MKAIILAVGYGTSLYPMTKTLSKQLLPVYDKPMIYYPLSLLMLLGIKDILLISTSQDVGSFESLLGRGDHLGIQIQYAVQEKPRGLAEAFLIGEEFIGDSGVCLILGDNLFYGQDLHKTIQPKLQTLNGALVFGYQVRTPSDFGIVEFDENMNVLSIEEKPIYPKSNYAVPGLYFYDNTVIEKAKRVQPSNRGELEITSVNQLYLKENLLKVVLLGRGTAWLDTGTPEALLGASQFVEVIQMRQGLYIACLEEIAWRRGFITIDQLESLGKALQGTEYGKYIIDIVQRERRKSH